MNRSHTFRFLRPTRKEDWDRPLYYASLIKVIDCNKTDPWSPIRVSRKHSGFTFKRAIKSLHDHDITLLPNLRVFIWDNAYIQDPHQASIILSSLALGSHLEELTTNHSAIVNKISRIVARNCDTIKTLQFLDTRSGRSPSQGLVGSLKPAVRVSVNLRHLSIGTFDRKGAIILSRLPYLESLKVYEWWKHAEPYPRNIPSLSSSPRGFPSLRSLSVHGISDLSMAATAHLFQLIASTPLIALSLNLNCHVPTLVGQPESSDFLTIFSQAQCISHLTSFTLRDSGSSGPHWPDLFVQVILQRLLTIPHMQHLTLETGGTTLTNQLLGEIGNAWHRLRELELKVSCTGLPDLTLRGLVPLAEGCPQLSRLTAFIDAMFVPDLDLPSSPNHNPPLTDSSTAQERFPHRIPITFNFLTSPMHNPSAVAVFLCSIFWDISVECTPSTKDTGDEYMRISRARWGEVHPFVREICERRCRAGPGD